MNKYEYLKKLKSEARRGDPEAEWELGVRYADGLLDNKGKVIVKASRKRAVFWYKRSSLQGHSGAQLNLGYCYDVGFGIRRDKKKALYWYKKAFKNGSISAAINVATIYRDEGKNTLAFKWYKKAALLGDGDALFEIGIRYLDGIGIRRSFKSAIECFEKAIRSDYITESIKEKAMYWLGMIYYEGHGVKRSLSKAKEWFEMANTDGDYPDAIQMIKKIVEEECP